MFMVKCKYFADANFQLFSHIRKFFANYFFKKNHHLPPHSLIFAIKARGNKSTSQQANKSTS